MATARPRKHHEEVSKHRLREAMMGPESGLGEALRTEGTATIQNLIVGRDVTGLSAFSAGA